MAVDSSEKVRRGAQFKRYNVILIVSVFIVVFLLLEKSFFAFAGGRLSQEHPDLPFSRFDWNLTALSTFVPPVLMKCDYAQNRSVQARDGVPQHVSISNPVEEALSYRAGIRGFHKKLGMTDPVNWMKRFASYRNQMTSSWFALPQSKRKDCSMTQPPYQYSGCLVHINHHYRFIWIKGKKVGGTSIREPLGWICGDGWKLSDRANATYCAEPLYQNEATTIEEAEKYWSEYFVFAFVRNPYSRFASSFTYINHLMGGCSKSLAAFDKVCYSPFLQAKVCSLMTCCWSGAVKHHIHHIMEQSSCLFTKSGKLAVDFVGETESLDEDLNTILSVINHHRSPRLPRLEVPGEELQKTNSHKYTSDDYAVSLYEESNVCLGLVEDNYYLDFKRLGYPRVTDSML